MSLNWFDILYTSETFITGKTLKNRLKASQSRTSRFSPTDFQLCKVQTQKQPCWYMFRWVCDWLCMANDRVVNVRPHTTGQCLPTFFLSYEPSGHISKAQPYGTILERTSSTRSFAMQCRSHTHQNVYQQGCFVYFARTTFLVHVLESVRSVLHGEWPNDRCSL